jgi:hypothetical protein
VDDRKPLEQQAPGEEKMAQKSHAVVIQRQLIRYPLIFLVDT